ncbi:MAG: HAMP domain-containing protein, partial [Deltaproteobacteria bacterium]|nr:HAMP domain-containing protein [Deltaproteobacteria bacterium]
MPGTTTSKQMRVVYPLWAKLGGVFGALIGVFIGLYGWHAFRHDLAAEEAELERVAVGLATTLAGGIDGDVHATFHTAADMDRPEYRHIQRWLSEARVDNDIWWIGTSTRDAQGHHHYVIDGDLESSFPPGYPIFDGIGYRERVLAGEILWVPKYEDEWGTWATAIAPISRKDGEVVALIEVVHDADALRLYTRARARRLALQILLAIGLVILTAIAFTRYVNRHLSALTRAAIGVSAGDLDRRVHIDTSDEIGVLGSAFNHMVEGLQEREFIRATFGRFVDPEVVDQVLADREGLRLGGDTRTVTVLMSDLRGFTAQVEQLGPTEMVALLNRYLAAMIRVANEHQGMVAELLGDGMVVFFGAPTLRPDDALRAVRCAVGMQRELDQFNAAEGRSLEMGIGLDTG